MEKTRKYLKFIAYLQIIGILCVVAGHSLEKYPDGIRGLSTVFYRSMMTFRMPLFMFVSGFLMLFTTNVAILSKRTPAAFIGTKLKRLILPFIVLTTVTFVPRALLSGMADDAIPLDFHSFVHAFIEPDNMPIPFFWFIQASFILLTTCFIIFYYSGKLNISAKVTVVILFIIFLAFMYLPYDVPQQFSIYKIKSLGVYFIAGCAYAIFAPSIDRYIPWTSIWFLIPVIAIWWVLYDRFIDTYLQILSSLAGIIMCISITKILEEKHWNFLDHLQGANYMIFLTSWYFNILSQQILAHFVTLPWWVHTILSLISGVYIPWLGYKYLERHQDSRWVRITALLLGQNFKTPSHKK